MIDFVLYYEGRGRDSKYPSTPALRAIASLCEYFVIIYTVHNQLKVIIINSEMSK